MRLLYQSQILVDQLWKALEWLLPQTSSSEGAPLDAVRRELEEVRSLLGKKGAPARAAQVVLSDLFS